MLTYRIKKNKKLKSYHAQLRDEADQLGNLLIGHRRLLHAVEYHRLVRVLNGDAVLRLVVIHVGDFLPLLVGEGGPRRHGKVQIVNLVSLVVVPESTALLDREKQK
jgi:hypothetical protein